MCVGCKQMFAKKDLVRVVKNKEGRIMIDTIGKMNGRGAYICAKKDCLDKSIKTRQLERTFQMQISTLIYDELYDSLGELDD